MAVPEVIYIEGIYEVSYPFYYNFSCQMELLPALLVNRKNRTAVTDGIVCWQNRTVCGVLHSFHWGARAHLNRESNEEGDDVNVAAERSDWSIQMNLRSLHALTEHHLIQPESLSQYLTNTQTTLSLREPHRYKRKGERERKGSKRPHFFIYLFTSSKRGNAIDKHETGDVDAHRLRCRHWGVYIRQNAGTASLSIKKFKKKKIINARCLSTVCLCARSVHCMSAVCVMLHAASSLFLIAGIFVNESAVHINILLHAHRWRQCSERPRCRAAPDGLRHPFIWDEAAGVHTLSCMLKGIVLP